MHSARLGIHHVDRSRGERALAFDDPWATQTWDREYKIPERVSYLREFNFR